MNLMQLPVAVAGALMPDAHHGYVLPIGTVLGVKKAVIPYGVGLDIGCRMALSVYPVSSKRLKGESYKYELILRENSRFGRSIFKDPMDDEVLENNLFREIKVLSSLHGKAYKQIGSSGSGNHFVEFGELAVEQDNALGLNKGSYLALLSHSGSCGMGAAIAQYYTRIAMDVTRLPGEEKQLAWLPLNHWAGAEYWKAMNLAGDYAAACHNHIHKRISNALGLRAVIKVENHHNFAWKEKMEDGTELIVHRKGATPAAKGELGIIPGSITAPGFVVSGLGNPNSLQSESHCAGSKMSRTRAKSSLNYNMIKTELKRRGIKLIGVK